MDFSRINDDISRQQENIIKAGEQIRKEKMEAVEREERGIELLEKIYNSKNPISKTKALEILGELISKAQQLNNTGYDSAPFTKWKNSLEAGINRVFIDSQKRLKSLNGISYSPDHIVDVMFGDGEAEIMSAFNKGVELTIALLESFQEEIQNYWSEEEETPIDESNQKELSKIFISHYSGDKEIVGFIVDLLESIGFRQDQIFCSSFPPYDIPLGENPMEYIKKEFKSDVLSLFVLTKSFFDRPICMCEMGAAWVKAGLSIPLIVPPLDYGDIKGVIKDIQGFKINNSEKLDSFYTMAKKFFGLNDLNLNVWQRKKNNFLIGVNSIIGSI